MKKENNDSNQKSSESHKDKHKRKHAKTHIYQTNKIKQKQQVLKTAREKQQITYRGSS